MDIQPEDPKTWFTGMAALFTGMLTWSVRRHIKAQDEHGDRIRALESDRVTKGDISAVYERINELADQSSRQHGEVLQTIIGIKRP